jgi:branched-chain amino acid aminotransferase
VEVPGLLFEVDDQGRLSTLSDDAVLPDGAYTTLRTYGGRRVLRLWQHVARLTESVGLQGSPARLPSERLRRGLSAALGRAGFAQTRVRVTFAPPRLFVALAPFEPLPAALYAEGVACAMVPLRRDNPRAKDTRFLSAADGARACLPAGTHEGLMVDDADGAILEGLSSNFFGVLGGELRTEGERVLSGVTRAIVLELAAPLLPARLEPVRRTDLPALREAFITSASRGVLPVVRIDGAPVGDGRPGALTRRLMDAMADLVEREAGDADSGPE